MFALDSRDSVHDKIKNRFTLHLPGFTGLDERIHVRISPRLVSFFYYDYDYDRAIKLEDNNKYDEIIRDNAYELEVGSISLTRPQNTGNDLLSFPQTINELRIMNAQQGEGNEHNNGINEVKREIIECNKIWHKRFWGFPFVDRLSIEKDDDSLSRFLRYCLLCFIFEFENRDSVFGESPIYNEVRENLRYSDVYNLLSAKLHYTLYLHDDDYYSHSGERYSFYTRVFANCLMNKRLNKVIRPNMYTAPSGEIIEIGIQEWFYDPEKELDNILRKNREHCQNAANKGVAHLDDSLVAEISSFLYSKHAVFKAMTTNASKSLFRASHCVILALNVVLLAFLISFTGNFWDKCFNTNGVSICITCLFIGLSVIAIVLALLSGIASIRVPSCFLKQRVCYTTDNHSCSASTIRDRFKYGKYGIDALLPRILFAEIAAWFTVGAAESLVKSMLWVRTSGISVVFFLVIILIFVLLVYKISQFSPYQKLRQHAVKALVILNHSVFFALILGCLMQGLFYNNMLKSSNVLSDGIYKGHFDTVADYLQRLEDLEKSIDDYRVFARDFEFGSVQLSGDNSGRTGIAGSLRLFKEGDVIDSVALIMENKISFGTTLNSSVGSNIPKYHDAVANSIIEQAKSIKEIQFSNATKFSSCLDTLAAINLLSSGDVIDRNISMINGEITVLKDEIRETKKHLMADDYESLIEWATRVKQPNNTRDNFDERNGYVNSLMINEQNKKCSIRVFVNSQTRDKKAGGRIFPQLLLLHTLIVLILTFVTHLIVSSKAVTAPITMDYNQDDD